MPYFPRFSQKIAAEMTGTGIMLDSAICCNFNNLAKMIAWS
jgi:hypothetical protein